MTTLEQVREVAADVFGVDPKTISESTSPDTVDVWDSVQHLNLVLALESRFGVQFEPEDIEEMKDVGTVVRVVDRRAGRPH